MPLPPDLDVNQLLTHIRDVPDFPKPGIVFKDISPLCGDAEAFRAFVDQIVDEYRDRRLDALVAVDARGFLFAGAAAYQLGLGVVLVRKQGKLPADTIAAEYDLEYGSAVLEMHADALKPGQRVVIVDDLLATGGTVAATIDLCRRQGAEVVGCAFLMELGFLNGREKLGGVPVFAPIQVDGK